MANNSNPVRGTKDFLPSEMEIRDAASLCHTGIQLKENL